MALRFDKRLKELERIAGLVNGDEITRIEVDFVDMDFTVSSKLVRMKGVGVWHEEWFEHPH